MGALLTLGGGGGLERDGGVGGHVVVLYRSAESGDRVIGSLALADGRGRKV